MSRPSVGATELSRLGDVLTSRWLGMGPQTAAFEQALRTQLGAKHVLAVAHGTDALHLALDALELRAGDEVLVPSLTFAATIHAIRMVGATPAFCEVEPATLNLDPDDVRARLGPRTRAILPVHFAGLACDLDRLLALARDHGAAVIEDAAHAFGSTYRGRPIGTWGDVTCFSFDAVKNITCGEGGAVATDRDDLAATMKLRRSLGMNRDAARTSPTDAAERDTVVDRGFRYHMSDLNAAIGLAQLEQAATFRARKHAIVEAYDAAFAGLPGVALIRRHRSETFPFSYVVRITDGRRDALRAHLAAHGIETKVHFIPNHLQPAFQRFTRPLPVTERLGREVVSLPFFVDLTEAEVRCVIERVQEFFAGGHATAAAREGATHG